MANQEHLEVLKQGTAVWNAWREQHPEVRPDLSGATLFEANLRGATLYEATLSGADLRGADLRFTTLVGTKLIGATLTECHIYGISAWDVELTGAIQNSLVITPPDEPTITVDNLKIAQFIYLLLNKMPSRMLCNGERKQEGMTTRGERVPII